MSWKNTGRAIQKTIMRLGANIAPQEALSAVLAARKYNTTITETDNGTNGKYRELKISYYPLVSDAADDTPGSICDTGEPQTPKQQYFSIKKSTKSKVFQINPEDIRNDDGNWTMAEHIYTQIANVLPALRKRLAQDVLTAVYAGKGCLNDGNTSRRVQLANTATGAINTTGRASIIREFKNAGYSDQPFIIGGVEVDTYRLGVNGGGTRQDGINTNQPATNMYYDGMLADIIDDGGEHILAFDPSVLKFVTFSDNAGMFATDMKGTPEDLQKMFANGNDQVLKGAIYDPVTGLLWDLNVHYDPCLNDDKGGWKWRLVLRWDIFFMPTISLNKTCVNGIYHFTTCPIVMPTCPSGDAPPSPAAPTTYEFDFAAYTYPLLVSNAIIGGIQTEPDVNVANITALAALFTDNSGITFSVSGTKLQYTGYAAISFNLNSGNHTGTFA